MPQRRDDITESAIQLQHAIDALGLQLAEDSTDVDAAVDALHDVAAHHESEIRELLRTTRSIIGTAVELRAIETLLGVFADMLEHVVDAVESPYAKLAPRTHLSLAAVASELLAAERTLLCRYGTILFPSETW